jgi:hypothetical protein
MDTDYFDAADMGYIHVDDLPDLEHCKELLRGVLDSIYCSGDMVALENNLDELCSQLEVKMVISTPILGRIPKDGEENPKSA